MVNFQRLLFLLILSIPMGLVAFKQEEMKAKMLKYLEDVSTGNITPAEIYQGQKAGYATGGGVTIRNRVQNLHPATITMPSFDAGCGGIDIYAGGLSFVNGAQLEETLKSIGSASAAYAFMLALETVSPQIANNIKQMQTWANNINSLNINSCETAAQLVGSIWPQQELASQHICQNIGTEKGFLSDRVSARHQCGTRGSRKEQSKATSGQNSDLLALINYNVAWEAIKKQGALASDPITAQFLMTLMGTIIVHDENVKVFPPKATDESFLKTMLQGGETEIYTCDTDDESFSLDSKKQCLLIKEAVVKLDRSQSWCGRIEEHLLSIQAKILKDEGELTPAEMDLMTKTHLPLWSLMCALSAYKKGVCPIDIKQIADLVVMDLLVKYLRDALELVRTSCMQLRYNVPYANEVDDYIASLKIVKQSILQYEHRSSRLMKEEMLILEKLDWIEKELWKDMVLGF